MTRSPRPLGRAVAVLLVLGLLAAACSSGGDDASPSSTTRERSTGGPSTTGPLGSGPSPIPDGIRIEVLSSQPDRVSGDDARIRVTPPSGIAPTELTVLLGSTDITASLESADGALEGVITGLVEGTNTLTATAGPEEAIQRIRAWPLTGPVISGPHLPLLACSTVDAGLGEPTDRDCSAPTRVTWRYLDVDGRLRDLPDPARRPDDLGTAEVDGREVPAYVRYEQGVINRSIYEIASIAPIPTDAEAAPAGPGWNRRLLYRFGGGCGTTYGQGRSLTTALEPAYLSQGYVVATATFNTMAVQCNDVLSAETTMMVKEHIIERFGVPDLTIGEGSSGGAAALHLVAQNYPGLVNGIVAVSPFPDVVSVASGMVDCGLLRAFYESPAGRSLRPDQRAAIEGRSTALTCQTWADTWLELLDPSAGCDPAIPVEEIFDPVANRGGVRCTLQDANRNQLGLDPSNGWGQRPLDNVGVQYGLEALNDGAIDVDRFLDLNEQIGGYDLDGNVVARRHEADPEVVLRAYEAGRIAMGVGDLPNIPIIDIDLGPGPEGDIHDRLRPFALRDRIARSDDPEAAPGFQIWTRDPGDRSLADALAASGSGGTVGVDAVAVLDEWITALRDDREGGPLAEVLRRTRPAGAVDNCQPAGAASPTFGLGTYDAPGPCRDDHPIEGDPRTAAGAPRAGQVLKCSLKPVDLLDYEVTFDADQFARLRRIFPSGVCDWRSPSVGEVAPASPDRSYEDVESPAQSA